MPILSHVFPENKVEAKEVLMPQTWDCSENINTSYTELFPEDSSYPSAASHTSIYLPQTLWGLAEIKGMDFVSLENSYLISS